MRTRATRRPERRWSPWSMGGLNAARPQFQAQALVDRLEDRCLLANPHFVVEPTIVTAVVDSTVTLSLTGGKIAGLGNEDVRLVLSASISANTLCTNPGGKVVPGQNKVLGTATGEATVLAASIRNGVLNLRPLGLTAEATLQTPTAEAAGCPNGNWSVQLTNITASAATLQVYQPPNATEPVLVFVDDTTATAIGVLALDPGTTTTKST